MTDILSITRVNGDKKKIEGVGAKGIGTSHPETII
jgi:hypothetical protein